MSSKKETDYEKVELPTDPNLPIWIISPKEEKIVFQRWRKKAFKRCDDVIKQYIACTNSYKNPLESMIQCQDLNKIQMDCVKQYQQLKYLDEERDILIQEKMEKRKQLN